MKTLLLIAAAVLGMMTTAIVLALPGAAVLMVALRLVHSDLPAVPALGFWSCLGLLVTVSLVTGAARAAKVNK